MDDLSSLYMEFPLCIADDWDSSIIFKINLSDSSVHFFNPEEPNIEDRKIYKSYLRYQIIEQWRKDDASDDIEQDVLLDVYCDECSAIVDYELGKQLERFNDDYRNYNFFLRPLGDGVTWYFKKEFYPDYFSSQVTPEMEDMIWEGKAHYPIKENIQMIMQLDKNGSAYIHNFSKVQFEAFIKFLIEAEEYFYAHPQPI